MDTPETPTDVQTREQMTSLLRDDANRVAHAADNYDAEARSYEYKTRKQHFLTDEAHQAAFKEYVGPLEEAETVALRSAGAATRNAFAVRAQLVETMALDDAEMVTAAQRQDMLSHDVAKLPLPRLAEEVRVAIARGDRPSMYLYAKYLAERTKAGDPRGDRPADAEARTQLTRMAGQIREILRDTSFDDVRKQIAAVLEKAGTLEGRANKRRRGLASATATTWDGRPKVAWPARAS